MSESSRCAHLRDAQAKRFKPIKIAALNCRHTTSSNAIAMSANERLGDCSTHELVRTETSMLLEKDALSPHSIIVFYVNSKTFPSPAPPPRLHYSTFWRSIARRIYNLHTEAAILTARAMSSKLRNTGHRTLLHFSAPTQLMQT